MPWAARHLLYLCFASHLVADPLDTWTWRNPLPTGDAANAIIHANGKFVAVGGTGGVIVSADATNWFARQAGQGSHLTAVTAGDGRVVAVGEAGTIVTSTDLTNWFVAPSPTANLLRSVTFGNGVFVAVGNLETIVTSTNGTNWSKVREQPLAGSPLTGVAFGNGVFLAVPDLGATIVTPLVSTDGSFWTPQPNFPENWGFLNITFGNGVFLAANRGRFPLTSRFLTSTNGAAWFPSSFYSAPSYMVSFDGLRFIVIGPSWQGSNVIYQSTNGLTATTNYISTLPTSGLNGLAYDGSSYVGVFSSQFFRSTNLLQWITQSSSLPLTNARILLTGNNRYLLAGAGPILVSSNGIDFVANVTTGTFIGGAFGTNTFVLIAGGGTVLTSSNANTWTSRNTGGSAINALTWGNGMFVAVGNSGDIRTSPNGASWSGRFSGTALDLLAVSFGGNRFTAVGDGGALVSSPDGISWTFFDCGTKTRLRCVGYGNGRFFAAGDQGTVRISSDGENWDAVDLGTTAVFDACAVNENNLILGGQTLCYPPCGGVIYSSLDAKQWRWRRPPFANSVIGIFPFQNKFMVFGTSAAADVANIVESGELSPIGLHRPMFDNLNGFSLDVVNKVGATARLQRSSNFVNWTDVLSFTNAQQRSTVSDSTATNYSKFFYRVVAP